MSARETRGFTLLEVLVAIFIMSLVITFAFQAYKGIAEAFARVTEVTSRDRAARILTDRIERELSGAVMVQREEGADPLTHPYFFFAEPRPFEESTGYELRFITQTPIRSPGAPAASLALVTYGVVQSQTGPGMTLLRQEEPVPAFLAKQVEWTSAQTMADNVATFSLGFGGDEAQATGGWDSTGEEQLDDLPESVEVSISLWEMGPDGEPWPSLEIVRPVQLPVRPFRLAPDALGDDASAGCETGMTVAACMEQFDEVIRSASPALAVAINDARSHTSKSCWNEPEPSELLSRLKVLMSGLQGYDPSRCQ